MDKFCKFCGTEHTCADYPKTCDSCSNITWINPTPVALLLQPVSSPDQKRLGILIGKRGIEPQKGGWGLPGGFIDVTDKSVEDTASRELFEETGFRNEPYTIQLMGSYSNGRQMLVFCRSLFAFPYAKLDEFVTNFECPEIDVVWEPIELCFASHTDFLKKWFEHFT